MNVRVALVSIGCFVAVGCGRSVDLTKIYADLQAANDRTCACHDDACVDAADKEYAKVLSTVHGIAKDTEAIRKIGELQVKHNECVKKAMAGMGKK